MWKSFSLQTIEIINEINKRGIGGEGIIKFVCDANRCTEEIILEQVVRGDDRTRVKSNCCPARIKSALMKLTIHLRRKRRPPRRSMTKRIYVYTYIHVYMFVLLINAAKFRELNPNEWSSHGRGTISGENRFRLPLNSINRQFESIKLFNPSIKHFDLKERTIPVSHTYTFRLLCVNVFPPSLSSSSHPPFSRIFGLFIWPSC